MRKAGYILFLSVLALTACDDTLFPTVTPERTLTGPTIAPTPVFLPQPPTEISFDENADGQSDPTAAALPADAALPPLAVGATAAPGDPRQGIQITAEDGSPLSGDMYQSGAERLPGILMLSADRSGWGDFPAKLHAAGFTLLVMNQRPNAPASDFTVMLQSLNSGDADPARLAVIGADVGADAALTGCAGDLLCDALILLSPSSDDGLLREITAYNPRPIFLTASEDDAVSFGMAQRLQGASTGQVLFQPFSSAGHGSELLVNRPDLGDLMIQWLQQMLNI